MRTIRVTVVGLTVLALAACGGGSLFGGNHPKISATCPPPSLAPTPPPATLDYPPSGSTNVSISIGEIIEKGAGAPGVAPAPVTITAPSGTVPLGVPTSAPSPLPSPFATPSAYGANTPYVAIPIPTLWPSTTYTVNDVISGYDPNNPPQCSAPATQFVGTFTTGS